MAEKKLGTEYVFLYWDVDVIETRINKTKKMAKMKPKGGKKVKC